MPQNEQEPYKVRASSWGTLFDCAHRWEGIHMLGLKGRNSIRAALGTAIHASTALYDQAVMQGMPIDPMDAAQELIDKLHHPREEIHRTSDDLTMKEAESIGLRLHARYCADISPRYDFVAVELETKPLVIDCGGGVHIKLTGTMDRSRAVRGESGIGISDVKTGARSTEKVDARTVVASTKGHAPQLATYEMLFEHTTGMAVTKPAEIIGLNTGNGTTGVGQIENPRRVLLGDGDKKGLIEYAASMFRTGLFPPNPQSRLCSEKYCPRWAHCIHHD